MTIKGLLIGSAAAIVAVSGAQAADAIVAAEPEAVEYVRVCDAFGAGFFYIPGSETCLKVGGYVRTQYNFSKDRLVKTEDANTWSRAQLTLDARNETDLGTLRSFFVLRGQPDQAADKSAVWVEEAFFEVAGLRAGKFFSIWDNGLSGDTDVLSSNALFNAARYTYDAGAFVATIAAEELQFTVNNVTTHNVGFTASAAAALAGVKFEVVGGYDLENEEGAVRAIATTQVGPGVLGASAAYATGANAYFAAAEWTVAAEYAVNVTEKLKVTPGVQYFADYNLTTADAWKAGVTADYAITSGLAAKAHIDYTNVDAAPEAWSGFVRVTRSF